MNYNKLCDLKSLIVSCQNIEKIVNPVYEFLGCEHMRWTSLTAQTK